MLPAIASLNIGFANDVTITNSRQELTGIVACPAYSYGSLSERHRGHRGLGEGGAYGPVGRAEHLLMARYQAHTPQWIDEQIHAW